MEPDSKLHSLLIASRNTHKIREIRSILHLGADRITSPAEHTGLPHVDEDGATFSANAIKKAITLAQASGLWTLADDSGLMVAALDNAPGVFSARYAGLGATDADNNAKLLKEMAGRKDREACFHCSLALASPEGNLHVIEGRCPGTLLEAQRGLNGFGYDPLFVPRGFDQTYAELRDEIKNRISHRAVALQRACSAWTFLSSFR